MYKHQERFLTYQPTVSLHGGFECGCLYQNNEKSNSCLLLLFNNKLFKMAKFNGEVTFKVTFKDLGVPVGFGMTNAIIFHECATQVGLKSPWTKIDKRYKDDRFKVEIIDKKINFN